MKPRRAIGLLLATLLMSCAASWLTPQQQFPALVPTLDAGLELSLPFEPLR